VDAALSFLGQLRASKFILLDDVGLALGDCEEFQRIWGMPGCTVLCTSRFPALTTPPLRVPTVGAPDSQTPSLQASSAGGDQPSPRPQLRRIWLPADQQLELSRLSTAESLNMFGSLVARFFPGFSATLTSKQLKTLGLPVDPTSKLEHLVSKVLLDVPLFLDLASCMLRCLSAKIAKEMSEGTSVDASAPSSSLGTSAYAAIDQLTAALTQVYSGAASAPAKASSKLSQKETVCDVLVSYLVSDLLAHYSESLLPQQVQDCRALLAVLTMVPRSGLSLEFFEREYCAVIPEFNALLGSGLFNDRQRLDSAVVVLAGCSLLRRASWDGVPVLIAHDLVRSSLERSGNSSNVLTAFGTCSKALTAFGTSSAFWCVLMFEFSSKLAPAAAARMYQDLRKMRLLSLALHSWQLASHAPLYLLSLAS